MFKRGNAVFDFTKFSRDWFFRVPPNALEYILVLAGNSVCKLLKLIFEAPNRITKF